jgi:molecular chaperone DnaK
MAVNVALDHGNGATKVAVTDPGGNPQVIRSERGAKSWPSVVSLAPDGRPILGEDAWELSRVHPEQVAVGYKMHLGDGTRPFFNGKKSAEDVVGMATTVGLEQAEKQTGQKFDGAVVVCPANFTDAQRDALRMGVESAGIKVVQVITEPAAAAYAYCWKKQVNLVMCIDVGHGTTDVTVLEVKDDGIAVPISTEGVPKLGGCDLTREVERLLLDRVNKMAGKSLALGKLPGDQAAELEAKAEKAKHALGSQTSTKVALNFGGRSQLVEITQAEYESAIESHVKQILACVDKAKDASGKTWDGIELLVLAGGPCQSPRLQMRIADHTGLVPKVEIDPEIVVAYGAALHGHVLALKDGGGRVLPNKPVLREATGHDLGVVVIDESKDARPLVCSVLVPKNTPAPHREIQVFRLPSEANTEAFIEIVQGPEGAPLSQCASIGSLHLKNLPREQVRSYRIEVTIEFDNDTIATVTARDLLSGITDTVSVKLKAKAA